MANHIYSTLTADQSFTVWEGTKDPKQIPTRQAVIMVAGKANVMSKNSFVTPKGMHTEVSDEQLKQLKTISQFNDFVDAGFIAIETKAASTADDAAKNMTPKDKSAQKTAADLKKTGGTTAVKTNKK